MVHVRRLLQSAGLTQFGVGGVKPFLEQLWDALRQEVWSEYRCSLFTLCILQVFEPVNKDIDVRENTHFCSQESCSL